MVSIFFKFNNLTHLNINSNVSLKEMFNLLLLSSGVGLAIVVLNTVVALYYNALVAYALYYMFASMQSPLPWSSCLSWADSNCRNSPLGTVYIHVCVCCFVI